MQKYTKFTEVIMPIYKTGDKKDGLTKYKVRVNYTDDSGKAHSLTRVAYGLDAAKTLEAQLQKSDHAPSSTLTVTELIDLYLEDKRHEICMCAPSISKLTS